MPGDVVEGVSDCNIRKILGLGWGLSRPDFKPIEFDGFKIGRTDQVVRFMGSLV
jgi:hypothetical protein